MRMLLTLALFAVSVFGDPPKSPVPIPAPQNQIQLLYKAFNDGNHDSQPVAKPNAVALDPKDVKAIREPVNVDTVPPPQNSNAKKDLSSNSQDTNQGLLQPSKKDVQVNKDLPPLSMSEQDKTDHNQKNLHDDKPNNSAPPTPNKADHKQKDNRRFLHNNQNNQPPITDLSLTEHLRSDNNPNNNAFLKSNHVDNKLDEYHRFLQNSYNLQPPQSNSLNPNQKFLHDDALNKGNVPPVSNHVDNILKEHQKFLQNNYNQQPPQSNSLNPNQKFMHDDGLNKGNVPPVSNYVENTLQEHQKFLQNNYNQQPPQSNSLNPNQKFLHDDGLNKGNVPPASNYVDNTLEDHQKFLQNNYNLQPPQSNSLNSNQKFLHDDGLNKGNVPPASNYVGNTLQEHQKFLQNNYNQQPPQSNSLNPNQKFLHDDGLNKGNVAPASNYVDNTLQEHQKFLQNNYNQQPPQSNSLNPNQKFLQDDGLNKGNVPPTSNYVDNTLQEHQKFLQNNYNLQPPQSNSLNSNQKFLHDNGLNKGNVPPASNEVDKKDDGTRKDLYSEQSNYNLHPLSNGNADFNQRFNQESLQSNDYYHQSGGQGNQLYFNRLVQPPSESNYKFPPASNAPNNNLGFNQDNLQSNYYQTPTNQNNVFDNKYAQGQSQSNFDQIPGSNAYNNNLDFNQRFNQNHLQSNGYQLPPAYLRNSYDFMNRYPQDNSHNGYNYPTLPNNLNNSLNINQGPIQDSNLQPNKYLAPPYLLSNNQDFNQRLNQDSNLQPNKYPSPPYLLSNNQDFNQRLNQDSNLQPNKYPSPPYLLSNNQDFNQRLNQDSNLQPNKYPSPPYLLSNGQNFNERLNQDNNLQSNNSPAPRHYLSNNLDFNRRFNQNTMQSSNPPLSNDPPNSNTFNGKPSHSGLQEGRRSLLSNTPSNNLNSSHEDLNSPSSGKVQPSAVQKNVISQRRSLVDSTETQPPGEFKESKKSDSDSNAKSGRRFLSQPQPNVNNNPPLASSQVNPIPMNTLNPPNSNVSENNFNSKQMSKYPNLAAALQTSEPNETNKKFLSPLGNPSPLYPPSGLPPQYPPAGLPGQLPPAGLPGQLPPLGLPGQLPPPGLPGQFPPPGLPGQLPPPGLPGRYMPGRLLGCRQISQMIRLNPYNSWRASPVLMSTIPAAMPMNITSRSQFGPTIPSFPNDVEDIENYSAMPGLRSFYPMPRFYDARERYRFVCPSIMQVHDQGCNCRAGWAVAPVSALADRYCIMYNGRVRPELSVHKPLSCCSYCFPRNGCDGGSSLWAWVYLRHTGTVSGSPYGYRQGCQNYKIPPCFGPNAGFIQSPMCVSNGCDSPFANDKNVYRTSKSYAHLNSSVQAIERDIFENGPVTVDMQVYEDFYCYQSGVYKHEVGDLITIQTVKLIGWGEQQGIKYWLATNSWGRNWGEQGFFKILKGFNECGIEQLVIAGLPLMLF